MDKARGDAGAEGEEKKDDKTVDADFEEKKDEEKKDDKEEKK